ncbi:MAG: hypothetical protein H0U08_00715 [Actinobacteria bacterium]|nr:hypothetical protein [Actinomycetota bacterium]
MANDYHVEGLVVLVTGGASGIGTVVVERLTFSTGACFDSSGGRVTS